MPDLRELRVFVAVADALSFTRAAEQLHFAQQTVSKTIRDLEGELGVELLERTSREVRLTAAGEALLEPAREALGAAELAFETARAVGTGQAGTVTVGFTPAVGPVSRAEVVKVLRSGTEQAVSVRDLRPGDLRKSLRDRTVDLAIASVTGTTGEQLGRASLKPSRMAVYVPVGHRLEGASSARLADFDGERLLTASRAGTPYTDRLVESFRAAGATVTPVEARITGGGILLTELAEREAVAAMPVGTVAPEGVQSLSVPDFTMPLVVLWPIGRPVDAVRKLLSELGDESQA
jgi:DNA-binding transcriptional LysR family regulator